MRNAATTIGCAIGRVNRTGLAAACAVAAILFAAVPVAAQSAPGTPAVYTPVAAGVDDPQGVLELMRAKGATELVPEALACYQEGLAAMEDGDVATARAQFTAAAELDPAFPESHLALARVNLFADPQEALSNLSMAVRSMLVSFGAQHLLLVNGVIGISFLLLASCLLFTVYQALLLLPRLHHSVSEYFRRWFPAGVATLLAVVFLLIPAVWRMGVAPVVFAIAGLMWSWMGRKERTVTGTLVGLGLIAPLAFWALSPLITSPLDPQSRVFLLERAMASPYSPGLAGELTEAIEAHPEDPDLRFALAMTEKRGGNLGRARNHYAKALELGADPAAVENNLGVVAFLRGDYDEAMARLVASINHDAERAPAHFNLSQTYAKKLYFEKADQELTRANRISFNRIRTALRHSQGEDDRTLIDEKLAASAFWAAAMDGPRYMPQLPAALGAWFPGMLWLLPVLGGTAFGLGLGVGRRLFRHLPTFACTNCSRPVCRRCLRRIRRQAYCASCGDALLRIQSSSYSRLVLDSRIRRNRRLALVLSRMASWLLPGFHAARVGHPVLSLGLCVLTALVVFGWGRLVPPITRMAWVPGMTDPWRPEIPAFLAALTLTIAWLQAARLGRSRGNEDRMRISRDEDDPETEEPRFRAA